MASGVHAPRVAVYDVEQLALKFDRHFDSEIVDFQVQAAYFCRARDPAFGRHVLCHITCPS